MIAQRLSFEMKVEVMSIINYAHDHSHINLKLLYS
jgi:hypothetical protein